jgi:hypothetical protein
LTALDVSASAKLTRFSCKNNQLLELDVSNNSQLTYLNCSANALGTLDLSKNKKLKYNGDVVCFGNYISGANLTDLQNRFGKQNVDLQNAPISAATAKVAPVPNTLWTGKQVKPAVNITLGAKVLKQNRDYTLVYGANTNIGVGTISIAFTGMYAGTPAKAAQFNVIPKNGSVNKLTAGKKKIKVTLSVATKKQQIAGYELNYRIKGNGKWSKKILKASAKSFTAKKLKKGRAYQFRVRTYKSVSGKTYYSAWSKVKISKRVR